MSLHRSPSVPRGSSILALALAVALVGAPLLAAPLHNPFDGGWSVERILSRVGQLLHLDGFGPGETLATTTKDGGSTAGGTEECPDDGTGTGGTGGTTSSSGTTTSGCEDDSTGGTTGSTAGSDPNGG